MLAGLLKPGASLGNIEKDEKGNPYWPDFHITPELIVSSDHCRTVFAI